MDFVAIGGVWVGSVSLVVALYFFALGVTDPPKLWVGYAFLLIAGLGGAAFLLSVPFLPNVNAGTAVLSALGGVAIIVVLAISYIVARNITRVDRASRDNFIEQARRRIEF